MTKTRIMVICPGRGSYTKDSLNYFSKFSESLKKHTLEQLDQKMHAVENCTLSELDRYDSFQPKVHMAGHLASPLIYACSMLDFLSINRDKFEIVCIAGNSMGWYISMACANAIVDPFQLIYGMGSMMKKNVIGGQIIYPIVDEEWLISEQKCKLLTRVMVQATDPVYRSINLGGYQVLAAEEEGIKYLLNNLPKEGIYPLKLPLHAAFHTPLLEQVSKKGFQLFSENFFNQPSVSLIDGQGKIWNPHSTSVQKIREYTLGKQVTETYDFTKSIEVGLKEFGPEKLVLLGPGNTLGGAIGQILIKNRWKQIKNKSDFIKTQEKDPILISMGLPNQRFAVE